MVAPISFPFFLAINLLEPDTEGKKLEILFLFFVKLCVFVFWHMIDVAQKGKNAKKGSPEGAVFNYSSVANLIKHKPSTIGNDYQWPHQLGREKLHSFSCILATTKANEPLRSPHFFPPTSSLSVAVGFQALQLTLRNCKRHEIKNNSSKTLEKQRQTGNL